MTSCKQIVEHKQYARLNGVMVDTFTASAIVSVDEWLGRVNPNAHAEFLTLDVRKMAAFAFKVMNRKRA